MVKEDDSNSSGHNMHWRMGVVSSSKEERQSGEMGDAAQQCYGSTTNNHDHQKQQYGTQDGVDGMINRMRHQGFGDSTRYTSMKIIIISYCMLS